MYTISLSPQTIHCPSFILPMCTTTPVVLPREWLTTPVFLPGENPWTDVSGWLQSMELQIVGHN